MKDIEEIVKEKNNKRVIIGKNPCYLVRDNMIFMDLAHVDIQDLIVPEFVIGLTNSNYGKDINIKNENIETINFSSNLKHINCGAFFILNKLKKICDLEKVEDCDCTNLFDGCGSLVSAPKLPEYITSMIGTFEGCKSLKNVPAIPSCVTNMEFAFFNCESLEIMPEIPLSVENMRCEFSGCISLCHASKIPENVKDMTHTFAYCEDMYGYLEIDANPEQFYDCLLYTATNKYNKLILKGNSKYLKEILETKCKESNIEIE